MTKIFTGTTTTSNQIASARKAIVANQANASDRIEQKDSFEKAGPDARLDTIDLSKFENVGDKAGAFKVGDLLNGMLPDFGKSVDPGNAAQAIAPGFMEPQLPGSGTDMLDMLGGDFGMASMAHTDSALAHHTGGVLQRGENYSTASMGFAGAALIVVGASNPVTAAAIAAVGIGLKLADSEYEATHGQSVGESIYDAGHPDPKPAAEEKPKTTTTTSGTTADKGEVAGEDGKDSGTDSASTSGSGDSSTPGSTESSDSEKAEAKSDNDEKSESGADPEVAGSYRYRPTMDEVQRQFGTTSTATTARSNPNPNDERDAGTPAVGGRSLMGTTDTRLVTPDGRTAQVGTLEQFGSTHIEGLGTVRPADTGGGEGAVRPQGGYNPAA